MYMYPSSPASLHTVRHQPVDIGGGGQTKTNYLQIV